VSFDKTPTKEDTMRTIKEMQSLRSDFASAENDSLFLNRYQSSTDYSAEMIDKSDVKELFRPVFDVDEGEVTDVIRDQGRVYLLKKLEETPDQVRFVVLSRDFRADPIATIDKKAEEADDFSFYAREDGFDTEVERRSLSVKEAFATKGNNFISGIGQSRQIMNFLENASGGTISEPLELSDQFVVIHVTEVTPPGVRPFEEVKEQIRTVVTNNKRKQIVVDRVTQLKSQHNGIEALAGAADKDVVTVESISQNAATIQGAGREPKVVGAIFGLEEGMESKAIEATQAVFVLRVDQFRKADMQNITPAARQQIRRELRKEKSSVYLNTWIDQLREEADIVDNRAQLLRS
jgi:peptidyl-prolyl cis-trans isomerase D